MTAFGQPSVEVFDASANQQPLELFEQSSSSEDQGADRNIGDELQRADEMLDKPQHHKYLAEAQKVDETYAVSPDEATHLYNAARDVTRMVMRMDDEEAQAKFARNQLEASVRRQLTTIRKIDLELVPLRVLVGDRLVGEGSELWQELVQQLTRLAEKIQAVSGV